MSESLVWITPEKVYGGSAILRVARHFACIPGRERVGAATEIFNRFPELPALGVVDGEGRALGILTRVHLFTLLGKPFGREILLKKTTLDLAQPSTSFDIYANLFQTALVLQDSINDATITYYLLKDAGGKFQGIFSSKDLLMYLSRMTQDDIELAAQLQERMVKPAEVWEGRGWTARAVARTAKGVGGDFYFYRGLGESRHFFALGDVSGKGVAASILTSLVWGTLRSFRFQKGLKELLVQLNESLIHTFQLEKYLTGVFVIFDEAALSLIVADMGHGHVAMVRNGRAKRLESPALNLPLGINTGLDPQLYRIALKPGDLFIAYTDGITEQVNAGKEEFGEDRLGEIILGAAPAYDNLPAALLERLEAWRQTIPQQDDMTWLQVRVQKDRETGLNGKHKPEGDLVS